MIKKHIFAGALCLMMAVTPAVAQQPDEAINAQSAEAVEQVLPDGQVALEADDVESAPVNEVIESEYARREAQAIKAGNLQENDSTGGAVTIIAMVIVISALAVLSILFLIFGKISSRMLSKKKSEATGVAVDPSTKPADSLDSGEAIAAIAAALAEHFGQGHDMEDTILTIRRMKRSYSPWNSKIYNMRETPSLNRNAR